MIQAFYCHEEVGLIAAEEMGHMEMIAVAITIG